MPKGTAEAQARRLRLCVLRGFLRRRALNQEQNRDREILDCAAEALNEEAFDVLRYQTTWLEGVDEAPEGSEG